MPSVNHRLTRVRFSRMPSFYSLCGAPGVTPRLGTAGLAHPIIVISSDSESLGDDSADLCIRKYLERRRSRCQTSSTASNMSDSGDSIAERDYEYGRSFATEPEISFTPSTHSDAEPELGPEAESRFNVQAEATTLHGKIDRRYLSTHSGKEPLIDGLPDTDKWANFYVEVSGNYEFGDQATRLYAVPKIKDFRDHRAITKRQQDLAVEKNVETLKAQICRDAPTLIGYDPSYKGKLKRREKGAGSSMKAKGKKATGGQAGKSEKTKPNEMAKDTRVKFPTFKKSTNFWLGEGQPSDFPGINIPPIRTLIPEFADDMGRKNVVRLNLRDGAAARHLVVTIEDSIKLEPGLAVTILHGLALPRDMERVPPELQPSLVHASAYLVQAGQASLPASNQVELVATERTRYHEDLKAEREKVRSYKGSLKTAKARIAEMEKEKEEMADKLKKAERELGQVLRREKRKMKEVDEKAYQPGYDRAGAEYMRDARKMVNDEVEIRVPIAYNRGYKDGVKAACGVLQLEADMAMTKSIPGPVVPELELPYTTEECEPLPPEEFPESEDDIEDITEAEDDIGGVKAAGADGEKGAEDAKREPMVAEKAAEYVA
ncbi:hypothetical protein RHMOL_Rhmol11G0045600 [Rhododendron molle]|uniref:Uncharacterized protein n=1 Tax=Rhododendron molle TaxID=49168 RepID=A0ACC0LPI1_RHOML|nr:hypothetical protein RHMOL_Rhmol11G0045600 [Rhododendron molle]